jgi:signal transduction histidine kinase
MRDRFFEKYASSGKSHGTGLGTYSARMMVDAMGGSIKLDTTEQDTTSVVVTLPAGQPKI